MSLAMQLTPIPPIMLPYVPPKPLTIACHQAACYWIYKETFKKAPDVNVFVTGPFSQSPQLMTELARKGRKLKPFEKLTPGTVLIFTDENNKNAEHTCIVRFDGKIAGYNQNNWHKNIGKMSDYSSHGPEEIRWRPGNPRRPIMDLNGKKFYLIEVPEKSAIGFMRSKFPHGG